MKPIKIVMAVCVVALLSGIFYFSSQPATQSAQVSISVTESIINSLPVVRHLSVEQKLELIRIWNEYIRKFAHFTIYFFLGMAVSGFLLTCHYSYLKKWIFTLGFCFLYAVSDELHQLFVPGRGCQFRDVMIDFSGALLGTIVILGIARMVGWIRKKRMRRENL